MRCSRSRRFSVFDGIDLRGRESLGEFCRRAGLRLEAVSDRQRRHRLLRSSGGREQQAAGGAGQDEASHSMGVRILHRPADVSAGDVRTTPGANRSPEPLALDPSR